MVLMDHSSVDWEVVFEKTLSLTNIESWMLLTLVLIVMV